MNSLSCLKGNIDLKAAAFKDGKMLGKVTHKPLYGNLLAGNHLPLIAYAMGWTGDIFGENDVLGADPTTFGLRRMEKEGNNASYTPWSSFALSSKEKTLNLSSIWTSRQR